MIRQPEKGLRKSLTGAEGKLNGERKGRSASRWRTSGHSRQGKKESTVKNRTYINGKESDLTALKMACTSAGRKGYTVIEFSSRRRSRSWREKTLAPNLTKSGKSHEWVLEESKTTKFHEKRSATDRKRSANLKHQGNRMNTKTHSPGRALRKKKIKHTPTEPWSIPMVWLLRD